MSYLSLTSWSLHRSLGPLHMTRWDEARQQQVTEDSPQPETIQLVDLPAIAAKRGFRALDVCHFHFPETSGAYLQRLKEAFTQSNVIFSTLLVDYGDISSADPVRRSSDTSYVEKWIDIASAVGAKHVRVVAGESDPTDTAALERAAKSLVHLMEYGSKRGVRVITENFRRLTATAENCLSLSAASNEHLGFICDFGNFKSANKHDEIESIVPMAVNVHAKAHYDASGMPDESEFRQCMNRIQAAQYDGPITVVYDGPGDEWAGIERVKAIVETYL